LWSLIVACVFLVAVYSCSVKCLLGYGVCMHACVHMCVYKCHNPNNFIPSERLEMEDPWVQKEGNLLGGHPSTELGIFTSPKLLLPLLLSRPQLLRPGLQPSPSLASLRPDSPHPWPLSLLSSSGFPAMGSCVRPPKPFLLSSQSKIKGKIKFTWFVCFCSL
jgi:hypothetical protein